MLQPNISADLEYGVSPPKANIILFFTSKGWGTVIINDLLGDSSFKEVLLVDTCLVLVDPSRRNWFCKSQLTSVVAIGL